MSKQTHRHNIERSFYLYKVANSDNWLSRFSLAGKWYSKTTKEADLIPALAKAHRIKMEYEIRLESGQVISSKRFADVANLAIQKMQNELSYGTGKRSYKDYIGILRKYHIPYFGNMFITSIDQVKLYEFEQWRIEQFKRIPNKSTILNHNAAFNRVFTEAVEKKWMLTTQVPTLTNKGSSGQRRAAFSKEEYATVIKTIKHMRDNSRKEITRLIRELLLDYVAFAVNTGLRPGTEMEALTWGDIEANKQDGKTIYKVRVRKGKTTKHTGTRVIICKDSIAPTIKALMARFPNRLPSDKIFLLSDGSETKELGATFKRVLTNAGLKQSADGERTLYSLRHTYITWQLLNRNIRMDVLAKQCGTSVSMIEQHYSHIVPSMFQEELSS
ncbi:integrase [Saccharobesus litoralis]|uniref:Integrase n=1 Tax=Saccharobesus litoralis TaxID=2172099 RepID=A0A2S0VPA3_9ALTE|nr:tyrosine-type recombinase/integrase [Saccharobesus litoralis]AWB66034.1 integrase [Saccharobesus litoralis]